ncbi:MAG: site-specific DNA-methyltransferase, partial [Thermoplasmata archaeon]|nr:site-specific DNA-methyltransferase [Thermoplasmata archaeon]
KVPYRSYRDDRPRREYLRWIARLGRSVDRALSEGGSFFLNMGGSPSDPWMPWDVAGALRERFVLQNVIVWLKSVAIDRAHVGAASGLTRDLVVGHYKPLRSERYVHGAYEYVFQFTRDGTVPIDRLAVGVAYSDKSNLRRWRGVDSDRRCRGNVWFLPYRTIRRRASDRPHPAPFPPELPERCLRLHGLPRARLVVDPFVGIGASAVAAARLARPFVGFDVDAEYLAETRRRLERLGTED